jgi:hypothetical protein
VRARLLAGDDPLGRKAVLYTAPGARTLGYDRFLPIYHRNAIRFWRKHYGVWAALAYRALLCTGMVLRLLAVPLGARVPGSRSQAAIAYSRVLRQAIGLGGPAQ